MTQAELIAKIKATLTEFPAVDSIFLEDLNKGLQKLAREFFMPDLMDSDTVTVTGGDTGIEALPADFSHSVYEATSTTNDEEPVLIYRSIKSLHKDYTTTEAKVGRIEGVAEAGSNLYALPVPEDDEALLIRFYRVPATLAGDSDEPEGIPDHLQEDLLVGWVVRNRYPQVSEKGQLKLKFVLEDYDRARNDLKAICKNSPRPKYHIRRNPVFF